MTGNPPPIVGARVNFNTINMLLGRKFCGCNSIYQFEPHFFLPCNILQTLGLQEKITKLCGVQRKIEVITLRNKDLRQAKKSQKRPYDKKDRVEKVRSKYQSAPFLTVPTRTKNNLSKMAGVVKKVVKILHTLYLT